MIYSPSSCVNSQILINYAKKVLGRELFTDKAFSFLENLTVGEGGGEAYKINLAGLNSTIFAGYKRDDCKKLALGLKQIHPVVEKLEEKALNIAFFHHPFFCHHAADVHSKTMLINKFDLILTGHLHQPDNEHLFRVVRQSTLIGAGAAFETQGDEEFVQSGRD